MRNSSLVEWLGAENVTGLKYIPKLGIALMCSGRGALCSRLKGDRKDSWTRQK